MDLKPLKGEETFKSIFDNKSETISNGYFRVVLAESHSDEIFYGFILPKKYLKLAVNRNYLRRYFKEVLRNINSAKGFKIIFMIKSSVNPFLKVEAKKIIEELKTKIELSLKN